MKGRFPTESPDSAPPSPYCVCNCTAAADPAVSNPWWVGEGSALVPFRCPGYGKTRLSRHLTVTERSLLSTAMLADVVDALRLAGITQPLAVTSGEAGSRVAGNLGMATVVDPPEATTLNDAIAHACASVGIRRNSVIVMADLPFVAPADLRRLVRCAGDVTILPSDDGGTAAIARRPSGVMPTAFGSGSAERHYRAAVDRGLTCHWITPSSPVTDVDTVEDLRTTFQSGSGRHTMTVLESLVGSTGHQLGLCSGRKRRMIRHNGQLPPL